MGHYIPEKLKSFLSETLQHRLADTLVIALLSDMTSRTHWRVSLFKVAIGLYSELQLVILAQVGVLF